MVLKDKSKNKLLQKEKTTKVAVFLSRQLISATFSSFKHPVSQKTHYIYNINYIYNNFIIISLINLNFIKIVCPYAESVIKD